MLELLSTRNLGESSYNHKLSANQNARDLISIIADRLWQKLQRYSANKSVTSLQTFMPSEEQATTHLNSDDMLEEMEPHEDCSQISASGARDSKELIESHKECMVYEPFSPTLAIDVGVFKEQAYELLVYEDISVYGDSKVSYH